MFICEQTVLRELKEKIPELDFDVTYTKGIIDHYYLITVLSGAKQLNTFLPYTKCSCNPKVRRMESFAPWQLEQLGLLKTFSSEQYHNRKYKEPHYKIIRAKDYKINDILGNSSIGRTPDFESGCWRFESSFPSQYDKTKWSL